MPMDKEKRHIKAAPVTEPERYELSKPVFVLGFMGAGKTTLSRKLARVCGVASVDLDMYVQRSSGMSINRIFEVYGQEHFRELETQALRKFAEGDPTIVSCGGGIILRDVNRQIMKDAGFCIFLDITAEESARRLADTDNRPNFAGLEAAKKTLSERMPLYEEVADATIECDEKTLGALLHETKQVLMQEGILWQQK
ncbi:MAG: shikimate kinase [Eggerthellaceae bacterium]|nr:shikimate kinase [Eggerthellaceae bacterium]